MCYRADTVPICQFAPTRRIPFSGTVVVGASRALSSILLGRASPVFRGCFASGLADAARGAFSFVAGKQVKDCLSDGDPSLRMKPSLVGNCRPSGSFNRLAPHRDIWSRCPKPHPLLYALASTASSIPCWRLNILWRWSVAASVATNNALVSIGSQTASPKSLAKHENYEPPEISLLHEGTGWAGVLECG